MKCPKCGYLGFETTDRCRNCQYDFSLTPFPTESELTLHGAEDQREAPGDFELPALERPGDSAAAPRFDLDRLFGDPATDEVPPAALPPAAAMRASEPRVSTADSALPFDDAPLVPPPAARTPLAVRRSTPEFPRNRPRTTRPVRTDSLKLESAPSKSNEVAAASAETVASLMAMPSRGVRIGAGLIDLVLLVGIDAAVLFLTLRITGLQNTLEDLRVLPPVPFVGFLAILAFGYVAAFTVAGGQTIGKMALSLRVIGDDGRPLDAAGGMLRALGCMLVPITLGLSFLPALLASDHRALHDRLAGTRVVQE